MKLIDKLNRVKLARTIIQSNLLSENEVTQACTWLGFNDTAFRDMKAKDKLKDFSVDANYWFDRWKVGIDL